MNILLINHYAGAPEYGMEYRPYYLARNWAKDGNNVTIVAASRSHLRTRAPITKNAFSEERIHGIRYVWLRAPGYHGNGLSRVVNILSFLTRLELEQKAVVNGSPPDVVIASSTYTLDIFPARRIALRFGAKLIYEVHDLWPLSPMELGHMSRWHPFIMAVQAAENYACRRSDMIVSLLPKAEAHFREHGMSAGKFAYIPNGIDVGEWSSAQTKMPEQHDKILGSLKQTGQFMVGYIGGHAISNALQTLIQAARLLIDEPVCFVLVGSGAEKERLQALAQRYRLRNLTFLPPVPKASVPTLLSSFDGLYIGMQRKSIYRFGISPNKLMDYMMSGKPILEGLDAGNNPVAESGCGITVPPENPQALARATRQLMCCSQAQRVEMGERGRNFVKANHDYSKLARSFFEVMTLKKAVA